MVSSGTPIPADPRRLSARVPRGSWIIALTLVVYSSAGATERAAPLIRQIERSKGIYDMAFALEADLRSAADPNSVGELVRLLKIDDPGKQGVVVTVLEGVAKKQPGSFDDSLPEFIDAIPRLETRTKTGAVRVLGILGPRAAAAVELLRPLATGQNAKNVYEKAWSAAALIKIK